MLFEERSRAGTQFQKPIRLGRFEPGGFDTTFDTKSSLPLAARGKRALGPPARLIGKVFDTFLHSLVTPYNRSFSADDRLPL